MRALDLAVRAAKMAESKPERELWLPLALEGHPSAYADPIENIEADVGQVSHHLQAWGQRVPHARAVDVGNPCHLAPPGRIRFFCKRRCSYAHDWN